MPGPTHRSGLLLFSFLLCGGVPVAAEEGGVADYEELDLENLLEVVFTAARHEQDIGDSPSAITLINREDIEATGATSLADLLRLVPGMDVILATAAFPALGARLPWIHDNAGFLVLLDGREANTELLGSTILTAQPVFLEDIERIEVIRGPAASLYGANAIAGVINIQTRALPDRSANWVRLSSGEIGTSSAGARISTRLGSWGVSLSGGTDFAGTFADPRIAGRRVWKLRALAEHRWSEKRRLLLDAGFSGLSGRVSSIAGSIDASMDLRTVRLSCDWDQLTGRLYWSQTPIRVAWSAPLTFSGLHLATIVPLATNTHTGELELQWNLPSIGQALLLVLGGRGRVTYLGSDQLLDAETFANPASPDYLQPGVRHWEARGGAFVHAEFKPWDWVTLTGGVRVDANTMTGSFISPRLAFVFRPATGQFIRLGAARAFRKPTYLAIGMHPMVEFPDGSPIQGADQDLFQQFMTRVIGNRDLENEEMLTAEAGYLGRFLDDKISLALDLYYNHNRNRSGFTENIVIDEHGLPDLRESSIAWVMVDDTIDTFGGELSIRYQPLDSLLLQASWSHKEIYLRNEGTIDDATPKNLLTLGGRFRLESGLVGSLYAFSRSEFWDDLVESPAGIMESLGRQHLDNVMLVLAKLGWQTTVANALLEIGWKLFLPISPTSGPLFRYHEKGGVLTAAGANYGGDELRRMVTLYLEGTF